LQRSAATTVVICFLATAFAVAWMTGGRRASGSFAKENRDDGEIVYLGSSGVIFQNKSNNCGVAALRMVLDHYCITVPRKIMEWDARLGSKGASMLDLKEMAADAGLNAEGWKLRFEDLSRIQLPAILFVRGHHFVVADSVDGCGFLFVRDPSAGRLKIPQSKAGDIWEGEALIVALRNR